MSQRFLDRALIMPLLRFSWTVSQRFSLSVPQTVEGQRFNVPLMFGVGFQNLTIAPHDRPLARAVEAVFGCQDGWVIDVGCNIGHFMQLCVLADRNRPYAGFDPSLACSFYMQRFIQDNQLLHHYVFPFGLGEQPAIAKLGSNGLFDVCASFSQATHPPGRFRHENLMWIERGDDVIAKLPLKQVALIKIDVEGLELEVLRGLEQTVAQQRPFVIFEMLQYATLQRLGTNTRLDPAAQQSIVAARREQALELGHYFHSRDYVLFKLLRDNELALVEDLDPRDASDPVEMDHLAVPREHVHAFLQQHTSGQLQRVA